MKKILLILVIIMPMALWGQTIEEAEYFFDNDPGIGNGTALTIVPADPIMHLDSAVVSGLSDGWHTLSIRFRDDSGAWSHAQSRDFYKDASIPPPAPQDIIAAEYFVDTDPGTGNGTAVAVLTPGTSINVLDSVNTTGLSVGFHTASVRFRYSDGLWGQAKSRDFYVSDSPTPVSPPDIVAAEYFVDTDPGTGNGTPVAVSSAGMSVAVSDSVDVNALAPGFHKASVRFQYDDGQWSHAKARTFYIEDLPVPAPQQIVQAEYFFNHNDPGWGQAFALNINNPAPIISWTDSLLTNSLSMCDTNTVHLRAKSSNGLWSMWSVDSFQVYSYGECACVLDSLFLSQNAIPSDTFQVIQQILADGMVPLDSVVVFYAGDEISLLAGFEVVLGGILSAEIESCSMPLVEEVNTAQKKQKVPLSSIVRETILSPLILEEENMPPEEKNR